MASANETPTLIQPADAFSMMEQNPAVLLLDVRSDMEYLMIGHPKGAHNVPWIDHPDWTVNPNFVANVRKLMLGQLGGAQNRVPIVLICRSGNRSHDAAEALLADGINELHIVDGGFEGPLNEQRHRNAVAGWRFAGLPWEQV